MGNNARFLVDWLPILLVVLPFLLVLCSSRVRGYEKLGWALISLFLSWIGFAAFMIVQSLHPTPRNPG